MLNTWYMLLSGFLLPACCLRMQQSEVKQKWWQWSMKAAWLNKSCVPAELPSLLPEIHTECESESEREWQRWKEEARDQRVSLCETGKYCPPVDQRTEQGYSVLIVQTQRRKWDKIATGRSGFFIFAVTFLPPPQPLLFPHKSCCFPH